MSSPIVTIVTPSYNQARFLERTIVSVLNQDYRNIEYIIIDGGSTDGSVEIIKKYQHRLAYWVSESDRGQSHAINKGFRHATGQIFNWLNSDDILMPSAARIAVKYLEQNSDIGMVYGDRITIDSKGNFLSAHELPSFSRTAMKYRHGIPQETVFIRRACWQAAGGVDEELQYCMDYDLWVKLSRITTIRHIPFVLGAYRQHNASKSVTSTDPMRGEVCKVISKYFGKRRHKNIRKAYRRYNSFKLFLEKKSSARQKEIQDIRDIIAAV